MAIDREGIKKLIKESGVKSLEDYNALMKEISKEILETLLDEEMTDHLGYDKHDQKLKKTDNSRNGCNSKEVKSSFGAMPLNVPRDRKSEFNTTIVKNFYIIILLSPVPAIGADFFFWKPYCLNEVVKPLILQGC